MALRLRRGTDAERQTITPLQGELIFTTDTNKLYVGGAQLNQQSGLVEAVQGGILVGPIDQTDVDLVNDTTPQLGGDLDLNGNDITGVGNINIDGTITATGNIQLGQGPDIDVIQINGVINSDLSPGLNERWDLGTTARRWRQVVASGADFDGEVEVGSLRLNGSIYYSDSTVFYDAASGIISVQGIDGDVTGSVFSDDSSTILVNAQTNALSNGVLTFDNDTIISDTTTINLVHSNTTLTPVLKHFAPEGDINYHVVGITDGLSGPGTLYETSRGTLSAPTAVTPGDVVSIDTITPFDGNAYILSGGLAYQVDPAGTVTSGDVPLQIALLTIENGDINTAHGIVIKRNGNVTVNKNFLQDAEATLDINGFAKLAVLTAEPASPADGMIAIADGATWDPSGSNPTKKQAVVRLGTAWVQLAIEP